MAVSTEDAVGPRPLSVAEIIEQASIFDYNPHIRLLYLLRGADTILKEAEIYEREGNDQKAFLLLYRHAQFVINKLATHPEARQPENRRLLADASHAVRANMATMESMKPRINDRHQTYQAQLAPRGTTPHRSASAASDGRRRHDAHPTWDVDDGSHPSPARTDPALYGATQALHAGENRELAVQIAHTEIRRRDATRRAVRQAGVSEEEEQERRTAGLWGDWESALVRDHHARGDGHDAGDDLSRRILDARRRGEATLGSVRRPSLPVPHADHAAPPSRFSYPTVPRHSSPVGSASHAPRPIADRDARPPPPPARPPPLPAKTPDRDGALPAPPSRPPPPRPDKVPGSDSSEALSRSASTTPPHPDLPSGHYTFKPSAYLENGSPLRTVFLPAGLRRRFLDIAAAHTARNLETCGMLCGTLISNALFISTLVIPTQTSTSDTCEMTDESGLFDYCDAEDLMVLGWIHTHPTQTCFMSSRDLHTHSGYQVMMAESVAIVCAPSKDPSWGAFRLTDPPGLGTVLQCTRTGIFHPHEETNIYTDAMRPGHVHELPGLEFQVEDLRDRR